MEWNLFIVPLTLIFTQLIKSVDINAKWLPWVAVLIGALLGVIYGIVTKVAPMMLMQRIVEGIVYGAAACGIYDAGVGIVKGEKWSA